MNDSYRQCQANILKQTEPKIVHKSTKTDSYKHTLIIYYLSEALCFSFPFLSFHLSFDSNTFVVQYLVVFFPLLLTTSFCFPLPFRKLFLSSSLQLRGSHSIINSCTRRKRKKRKKMHARTHAKTKVNKSLTPWFTEDARTEQQRKRNLRKTQTNIFGYRKSTNQGIR